MQLLGSRKPFLKLIWKLQVQGLYSWLELQNVDKLWGYPCQNLLHSLYQLALSGWVAVVHNDFHFDVKYHAKYHWAPVRDLFFHKCCKTVCMLGCLILYTSGHTCNTMEHQIWFFSDGWKNIFWQNCVSRDKNHYSEMNESKILAKMCRFLSLN